MRISALNKRSVLLLFSAFLLASAISFVGYIEMLLPAHQSLVRAAFIVLIMSLSIVALLCFIDDVRHVSIFHCIVILCIVYSFSISTIKGDMISALSPLLRLASFVILSIISFNMFKANYVKTRKWVILFFCASAFFFIVQTLYDMLTGGGVYMNSATRYFGSVGSPIGFAATLFPILCCLIYFRLELKSKIVSLLIIGTLWAIVMTSTRSISVIAFLVTWGGIAFALRTKYTLLWIVFTPVLGWVLFALFLSDHDFFSRLVNTISNTGLDGSSSFRLFILDVFFEHISFVEIVFGLGLGSFHNWFESASSIADVAPHFEMLWILSEFGVFIFLVYFIYGISYVILSFSNWVMRGLDLNEYLVVSLFVLTPQLFLQFANPFYFYQFVVFFGLFSGLALSKFDLACYCFRGR